MKIEGSSMDNSNRVQGRRGAFNKKPGGNECSVINRPQPGLHERGSWGLAGSYLSASMSRF